MESFEGKLAVVTGGGTGMGRELVVQLAAEGCHVAACDVNVDNLDETARRAEKEAPAGTRITGHRADVATRPTCSGSPRRCSPARHRPREPRVQQRRRGRRRELPRGRPRGVGAHLRHLLGRRLQRLPRLRPAPRRQRRGPPREHQQRERLLGDPRPRHAAHRLQRGQVRGEGLHRGAPRGLPPQRAARARQRGDAGPHRHRHREQQPAHPRRRLGPGPGRVADTPRGHAPARASRSTRWTTRPSSR